MDTSPTRLVQTSSILIVEPFTVFTLTLAELTGMPSLVTTGLSEKLSTIAAWFTTGVQIRPIDMSLSTGTGSITGITTAMSMVTGATLTPPVTSITILSTSKPISSTTLKETGSIGTIASSCFSRRTTLFVDGLSESSSILLVLSILLARSILGCSTLTNELFVRDQKLPSKV